MLTTSSAALRESHPHDLEITKDNAKELEGKKVVLPVGSAAHYGFLKQMEHFGVDIDIRPCTFSCHFADAEAYWREVLGRPDVAGSREEARRLLNNR